MKNAVAIGLLVMLPVGQALAQDDKRDDSDGSKRGYVLKQGQGEKLGRVIIKASPQSGTQGGVMVLGALPPGFYTGLHIHHIADEFFYVLSGRGTATLGDEHLQFEAGDVIFSPAGETHEIKVDIEGPMELLYFMDKPGADGFVREVHARTSSDRMTLAECNKIGAKYEITCVTN